MPGAGEGLRFGVTYTQAEVGLDSGAVAAFARGVEAMGYDHISSIDHVVGANPASRPGWKGRYALDDPFHEPLTLFGFMAGVTSRLRFMSGIIILPQRQAVLLAKQAASLDVLSGGRLRLGVGTGWNDVEYQALNTSFIDRGRVFDEQIALLRALWTQEAVTFHGVHHHVEDAGINPLPIQRPIPIWFGGGGRNSVTGVRNDKVLRRIARLGDGWLPPFLPDDEGAAVLGLMHEYCAEIGRDPAGIGLEGYVHVERGDDKWLDRVAAWKRLGAHDIMINIRQPDIRGVDAQLRRLEEIMAVLR